MKIRHQDYLTASNRYAELTDYQYETINLYDKLHSVTWRYMYTDEWEIDDHTYNLIKLLLSPHYKALWKAYEINQGMDQSSDLSHSV